MESVSQKKCTKCGKIKQISEFYNNKARKDGHSSRCKTCEDASNKAWAITNREKIKGYIKKCTLANLKKYREYYRRYREENREKIRVDGRKYWETRKEQKRVYDQEYHKKNANRKREYGQKYRAEHPGFDTKHTRNRRALKIANGGVVTDEEWQEVLDKYGHKCLRCFRTDVKLSMDHVVPLSRGGKHSKENIQPLCVPCNSWKNNKIIDYRPQ